MDRRELLTVGAGSLAAALLRARRLSASEIGTSAVADWEALRSAYDLAPDVVYLNHASIGTTPRAVAAARQRYLDLCESNPWLYMWGGAWEEGREATRAAAAAVCGCEAGEVAITHNTTEGFNILAQGLPLGPGDEVLFSSMNHAGASVCWEMQGLRRGYSVRRFDFPIADAADLTAAEVVDIYAAQFRDATRVLAIPHIDNIVGLRYPLPEIAERAHAAGIEFVAVDGAQAAGMVPLDLDASGVDFYATSGHKWLQGPKGTGLLYVRATALAQVNPMWATWGQARWEGTVRALEDYGTRNLAETLTLGDAIEFQRQLGTDAVTARLRSLHAHAREVVEATPGLRWRSPRNWDDGSSLFAVSADGVDAAAAFERLYPDQGMVFRPFGGAQNTVRVSPNVTTRESEIERFLQAFAALA